MSSKPDEPTPVGGRDPLELAYAAWARYAMAYVGATGQAAPCWLVDKLAELRRCRGVRFSLSKTG